MAERLVFLDFSFSRFPNGLCHAEVTLQYPEGEPFVGVAEGSASQTGALRCAAKASVAALRLAVDDEQGVELLGVKAMHAFDSTIVVVSVGLRQGGQMRRFVGSYVAEESSERAAAIAVLNATNRCLERDAFTRS